MLVTVVAATKHSAKEFFEQTSLGRSLNRLKTPNLILRLFDNNTEGLSTVYNRAINLSKDDSSLMIFCHDDVTISDYFWIERIKQGLDKFDIVGVVGNKRRLPKQPSWAFAHVDFTNEIQFTHDDSNYFSGIWGDGWNAENYTILEFPPVNQQTKLLDGFFLAAYNKTLLENQILFDEQFTYHFYDMDFCRTAESKNKFCGTIDLFLIHGKQNSTNGFMNPLWKQSYFKYLEKWGD